MKNIRQSMGSPEFARKVFEKVFREDIERLRDMPDMWKSRKQPVSLDFDKLQEESTSVEDGISGKGQRVWSEVENFAVFKDRSVYSSCQYLR